jgi:hypothetical protein
MPMNPEEKELLADTFKLSEENNRILRGLQRTARWSIFWGFIKIALFVIPLVAGYLFLQPYLDSAMKNYSDITNLLHSSPF